jgi:hypothetical protein
LFLTTNNWPPKTAVLDNFCFCRDITSKWSNSESFGYIYTFYEIFNILKPLPINFLYKIIFGKKILEQRKLCVLIEKNLKHPQKKNRKKPVKHSRTSKLRI